MLPLLFIYSLGALYYFVLCFRAFIKDKTQSAKQIRFSLMVLVIVTVFWPVIAILSCIEKSSVEHLLNLPRQTDN